MRAAFGTRTACINEDEPIVTHVFRTPAHRAVRLLRRRRGEKPTSCFSIVINSCARTIASEFAKQPRKRASMTSNSEYTEAYLRIIADLNGDVDGRRSAHAYMKSSTAIVHHRVVDCSYLPRLFNQATYDVMKENGRDRSPHPVQGYRALPRRPRLPVAFSISTRDSPSSSCCRATTTRCCPSHASTRS